MNNDKIPNQTGGLMMERLHDFSPFLRLTGILRGFLNFALISTGQCTPKYQIAELVNIPFC